MYSADRSYTTLIQQFFTLIVFIEKRDNNINLTPFCYHTGYFDLYLLSS